MISDQRIDAAIREWMSSDDRSADGFRQRMRAAIAAAFPENVIVDMLRSVFAITAEGTSENVLGYGAPYKAPFFIIDTSTAEPEVNWPGELVEQVDDIGEVGKRLHAARVAAAVAALT